MLFCLMLTIPKIIIESPRQLPLLPLLFGLIV